MHGITMAKSKLTRKTIKRLGKSIGYGLSYKDAAQAAGICQATFHNWKVVAEGPNPTRLHLEFLEQIDKAESIYIDKVAEMHYKAATESSKETVITKYRDGSMDSKLIKRPPSEAAMRWYLERRRKDRFGGQFFDSETLPVINIRLVKSGKDKEAGGDGDQEQD